MEAMAVGFLLLCFIGFCAYIFEAPEEINPWEEW